MSKILTKANILISKNIYNCGDILKDDILFVDNFKKFLDTFVFEEPGKLYLIRVRYQTMPALEFTSIGDKGKIYNIVKGKWGLK